MSLVFARLNQHFVNVLGWSKCVVTSGLAVIAAQSMIALVLSQVPPAAASSFDIPAQSLGSAIDAFCAATGTEVFYDGAAAIGRRSSPITGSLAQEDALRGLLAGTELVALRVRANSYLLLHPGGDAAHALALDRMAQDDQYQRYFAVVQGDIERILCRNPDPRFARHRLVLRLWVGSSGLVQRSELSGSNDEVRDSLLVAALGSTRLAEPPPIHMPQPITLVMLPGAMAAARCGSSIDKAVGR